jgi:hypothetical protein
MKNEINNPIKLNRSRKKQIHFRIRRHQIDKLSLQIIKLVKNHAYKVTNS